MNQGLSINRLCRPISGGLPALVSFGGKSPVPPTPRPRPCSLDLSIALQLKLQLCVAAFVLLGADFSEAAVRRANATTTEPRGFYSAGRAPYSEPFKTAKGEISLNVVDRVVAPSDKGVDQAELTAELAMAADRYRVELAAVGARMPFLTEGGVILERSIYGRTGIGPARLPLSTATVGLWGRARVYRNGELVTDQALIHVAALAAGFFADDDTHRLLPQSRARDGEIQLLVENLPLDKVPGGFLQWVYDDVQLTIEGTPVATALVVPSTPEARPEELRPDGTAAGQGNATFYAASPVYASNSLPAPAPNSTESSAGIPSTPAVLSSTASVGGPSVQPLNATSAAPAISGTGSVAGGIAGGIGGSGIQGIVPLNAGSTPSVAR